MKKSYIIAIIIILSSLIIIGTIYFYNSFKDASKKVIQNNVKDIQNCETEYEIIPVPDLDAEVIYCQGNYLRYWSRSSKNDTYYIDQIRDKHSRFSVKGSYLLYSIASSPMRDYPTDHLYDLLLRKEVFNEASPYAEERGLFSYGNQKYFYYCSGGCLIYTLEPFNLVYGNNEGDHSKAYDNYMSNKGMIIQNVTNFEIRHDFSIDSERLNFETIEIFDFLENKVIKEEKRSFIQN